MYRLYFGLLILTIVAALTVVALALTSPIQRTIEVRAERQNYASGEVVQIASRLHDYSIVRTAEELARSEDFLRALQCPTDEEELAAQRELMTPQTAADGTPIRDARGRMLDQRGNPIPEGGAVTCARTRHGETLRLLRRWVRDAQASFEEAEGQFLSARALGFSEARGPDILLIADSEGVVVARAGHDLDHWHGPERPNMTRYPVVGRAELFGTQYGFIPWQERDNESIQLARVAATPLHRIGDDGDREFVGVVLVGYLIANTTAEEMVQLNAQDDIALYMRLGQNVAIPGSSLQSRERLRQHLVAGRHETSAGEEVGIVELTDRPGLIARAEHDGGHYLVGHRRFATEQVGDEVFSVGALVVTPVGSYLAPVQRMRTTLLPVAIAFFFIGGLGVLFVLRSMLRPIEEISRGVHEVIAGNREFMWEVDEGNYLNDLSHSLNIMSARLQGKPDPDTDHSDAFVAPNAAAASSSEAGSGGGGVVGLGGLRGRRSREESGNDGDGGAAS